MQKLVFFVKSGPLVFAKFDGNIYEYFRRLGLLLF
jgi:hypothetical protein